MFQNVADDHVLLRISGTGQEVTVCREELQSVNPAKLDKTEDMSSLSYLNEASVLHNLRQRYYSSLIYVSLFFRHSVIGCASFALRVIYDSLSFLPFVELQPRDGKYTFYPHIQP